MNQSPKYNNLKLCPGFVFLAIFVLGSLTLLYLNLKYSDSVGSDGIANLTSNNHVKAGGVIDGFLVYNPKCHLASKNFLDPSILDYIYKAEFIQCTSLPLLSSIDKNSDGNIYLVLHYWKAWRYWNMECCWSIIYRPIGPYNKKKTNFDSDVRSGPCISFEDRVKLDKNIEIVFVQCVGYKLINLWENLELIARAIFQTMEMPQFTKPEVYTNVHPIINPKKIDKRNFKSNDRTKRKLSVLIIGHDSISRLNFHRTMPITASYLERRGFLEFMGYNKMAKNTFPNLMALLTGYNESWSFNNCSVYKAFGFDDCPFVWKAFRKVGYVTAWGEEQPHMGTFTHNQKVGFVNPPVDYYFRPYFLGMKKNLRGRFHFGYFHCSGPEPTFFRVVSLAYDFAKTFLNRPYFGLFWTSSLSHDSLNGLSAVDYLFCRKLIELEEAGVFENSMVILMSDHGLRYASFRATDYGWYEDRLPFLYIRLPQWFKDQNPETQLALIKNQNKLLSAFDLYETLRDVVIRAGGNAPPSSGCPNCTSLFKPVPFVRGCRDAGINLHWCACAKFKDFDIHNEHVSKGVEKFLEHVESTVEEYEKNGTRLCAELKLKKIHKVKKIQTDDDDDKTIELFYILETTPGGAKFELTIGYDGYGKYIIRENDISRIDSYHESSKCLKKGKKKYCICNESI